MPPYFLQRAVLMGNQCDWACWFLKEMVTGVVRKIDADATVQWLRLIPRPLFEVAFSYRKYDTATIHSVLIIAIEGRDYILDPSGEQYGIPARHLFLPWDTYRKRYVMRSQSWAGVPRWTTDTRSYEQLTGSEIDNYWVDIRSGIEAIVRRCVSEMQASYKKGPGIVFDEAKGKYEDKIGSLHVRVRDYSNSH